VIPFEVPDRFLDDVASGAVRRIGAMLHDRASGRILAHLQETSWLAEAVEGAAGGAPGLIMTGARLASSIVGNIQLHRLQGQVQQALSMLSALQMLSGATLAASVAGIGVSAVGFAVVTRRLNRLDQSLQGVQLDVQATRQVAERIDIRAVAAQQATVESLLCRAEEAWSRSDSEEVEATRRSAGPIPAVLADAPR
jgi:hypothetical protein